MAETENNGEIRPGGTDQSRMNQAAHGCCGLQIQFLTDALASANQTLSLQRELIASHHDNINKLCGCLDLAMEFMRRMQNTFWSVDPDAYRRAMAILNRLGKPTGSPAAADVQPEEN